MINVSVIIPVYNEEKHILQLLDSLVLQDYDLNKTEFLFVDGMSKDKTIESINKSRFLQEHNVKILSNEKITVKYAMNIGIKEATGKFIVRLDAHSIYPVNYISTLVNRLDNDPSIGNVGGCWCVDGDGLIGKSYAIVLSSLFGVGNSSFRLATEEQEVDTVPFGAYRKDMIVNIGMYDERLERNEDYELNKRISRNGYKIILIPSLVINYKCRSSMKDVFTHEIADGRWNTISLLLVPSTFKLSHFIPFFFVVGILLGLLILITAISPILSTIFLGVMALYLAFDIFFSLKLAKSFKQFFALLVLYPVHHIGCGIGSILGFF